MRGIRDQGSGSGIAPPRWRIGSSSASCRSANAARASSVIFTRSSAVIPIPDP